MHDGLLAALSNRLSRHEAELLAYIRPRIGDGMRAQVSAEDLVQQTFVDALCGTGAAGALDDAALSKWLRVVCLNNLRDVARSLRPRGSTPVRQGHESRSAALLAGLRARTRSMPSRVALRREDEAELSRAMGELPEFYRRVIELYDLQGLPIEEVARQSGRSEGAVHMTRRRARAWLGRSLQGDG